MPRSVCPDFSVPSSGATSGPSFALVTEPSASFAVVTLALASLLVVTAPFLIALAITELPPSLALEIAPLPILPGKTALGPSLPAITDFGASLPEVTACLRIAAAVTAPCLSWFGPTLPFGSPAATAAPPRATKRAIEAITFA